MHKYASDVIVLTYPDIRPDNNTSFRSSADGEGVTGKVQSLTKELESERQARQTAESEMELFRKDHQVLKKQFELTNQRVGTLIQQVDFHLSWMKKLLDVSNCFCQRDLI